MKYIYVVLFILNVTVHLSYGQLTDILNPDPQRINAEGRVFLEEPEITLRYEDLEEHAPLVNLSDLHVIDKETVFLWDTRHYFRFQASDPNNIMRIGSGFGGGPDEYRSPMNSFVRNGKLYSVDDEAMRIHIWDAGSGEFQKSIRMPRGTPGTNIVVSPDERSAFVLLFFWSDKGQLHEIDLDNGKVVNTYFKLAERAEYLSGYCSDGRIAMDESGYVYYASNNASNLTKFKPGQPGFVYNREVISAYKNDCKVVQSNRGNIAFNSRSENYTPTSLDIDYYEGKIYLLHGGSRTQYSGNLIDVYDAASGDYQYSLKLRYAAREIAIADGHIYGIASDRRVKGLKFTVYKMPEE